MIRSPTGFGCDNPAISGMNNDSINTGTTTTSDNLILRVDGTIAGGPILDPMTRHKAAGGSWKYIETTENDGHTTDGSSSNDTNQVKNASLQIRFIIPPKKDRVLVMEGPLKKFSTLPETTTDGLLSDIDERYICSGNVWIEDATIAENPSSFSTTSCRDEIGTFSIVKILNNSPIERNS
jgi:hypothetical protein